MSRLSLLDSNFLITESRQTPMHVASVSLYRYPKGVNKREFLTSLRDILLNDHDLRPPFNQHLSRDMLSRANLAFSWERDRDIDLEFHVRHSALPKPGRYRELFTLISRLHSTLLDRSRPLWELHLIEGLAGGQFALYLKTHHCLMDGVAGMQMLQGMLSETPDSVTDYFLFSRKGWEMHRTHRRAEGKSAPVTHQDLRSLTERLAAQFGSGRHVVSALIKYGNVWLGGGKSLAAPWHAVPRGGMSRNVSGSRRFVAQSWPLARVRTAGKAMGGTLNDAVLAMCGGALRRYLLQSGDLPRHSLKAMVPVSLRQEGDLESANAVGFIVGDLATDIEDPGERFQAIRQSMIAGKEVYSGLTPGEATLFTQINASPLMVFNLLGIGHLFPAYNLIISNVPGPRKPMYWNGAQLDGLYPASIVVHGQALNITLVSYAGQLDFGIIACRRSMPSVQRLIDFMEDSLRELEEVGNAGG